MSVAKQLKALSVVYRPAFCTQMPLVQQEYMAGVIHVSHHEAFQQLYIVDLVRVGPDEVCGHLTDELTTCSRTASQYFVLYFDSSSLTVHCIKGHKGHHAKQLEGGHYAVKSLQEGMRARIKSFLEAKKYTALFIILVKLCLSVMCSRKLSC